jgi:type IV fimbrial biogenesis protein FimT
MECTTNRQAERSRAFTGRQSGYGMVELLSVIGIATILTVLAVPSYRYVTNSNRASAEVNGLVGDLELARSAAIERGLPVSVCPSQDGRTCTANSQTWQHGWIVFLDANGNAVMDADDKVLLAQTPFASGTDTLLSDPGVTAVTFNRDGFAFNLPDTKTGYVTFTLHTQPQNQQWTRCVQVTVVGIVTTQRSSQEGCI